MNTKLHAVADAQGRPISLFVTAGPVSDCSGAAALLRSFSKTDWFRDVLKDKGVKACIPYRKGRKKAADATSAATASRSCSEG